MAGAARGSLAHPTNPVDLQGHLVQGWTKALLRRAHHFACGALMVDARSLSSGARSRDPVALPPCNTAASSFAPRRAIPARIPAPRDPTSMKSPQPRMGRSGSKRMKSNDARLEVIKAAAERLRQMNYERTGMMQRRIGVMANCNRDARRGGFGSWRRRNACQGTA